MLPSLPFFSQFLTLSAIVKLPSILLWCRHPFYLSLPQAIITLSLKCVLAAMGDVLAEHSKLCYGATGRRENCTAKQLIGRHEFQTRNGPLERSNNKRQSGIKENYLDYLEERSIPPLEWSHSPSLDGNYKINIRLHLRIL